MKKTLLFLVLALAVVTMPHFSAAQGVAINADSSKADPSAILDLKSTIKGFLAPRMTLAQRNAIAVPAVGLLIYQTDNTPGFYCYTGASWTPVSGTGGGSGTGIDSNWSLNGNDITNSNPGNVGVNTTNPIKNQFQIGDMGNAGFNGNQFAIGNGTNAFAIAQTNNYTQLASSTNISLMSQSGTGMVGIGTLKPQNRFQIGDFKNFIFSGGDFGIGNSSTFFGIILRQIVGSADTYMLTAPGDGLSFFPGNNNLGVNTSNPLNRLQVGDMGSTGIAGNDIAFGNGASASALSQGSDFMQLQSSTDITLIAKNGAGNVGINSPTPVLNELQVGSVGSTGFTGNNFAIGNGAQATAFNQYGSVFQIASNTDFALLPQAGAGGKVGINTATPRATLDVVGSYNITPLDGGYSFFNFAGYIDGIREFGDDNTPVVDISIMASNNIYANEFDAYSDIRIKNLIGTSDAQKDLTVVDAIKIRNYTMKDSLKYDHRHFKKVIAQELEMVDPDLVSKHPDFIPNVYQITDRVTKTPAGYQLHFVNPHHLGDTAKTLQALINNGSSLQPFDIVSIPSPTEVIIDAPEIRTDNIFVYGERVPNFRTVDYEGLTTLNISATQELSRQVKDLQKALATANRNIQALTKLVRRNAAPSSTSRLTSTNLNARKNTKQSRKI